MEMNEIIINELDDKPVVIRNAFHGRPYQSDLIILPENVLEDYIVVEGISDIGLSVVKGVKDGGQNTFSLVGTPTAPGNYTFTLNYALDTSDDAIPIVMRDIVLTVQPNARALWRNIETPKDIDYYKEDIYCEFVKADTSGACGPVKDMVAASRRGRSHAQEGRPRDDHFRLEYRKDSGWYIMAVADGAGSAKFSRRGSQIACNTVVELCMRALDDNADIDKAITAYNDAPDDATRKVIGDMVYRILGNAAYQAHKRINEEAAGRDDAVAKDYATTLLLAISKQYSFGWFIATFWVGDGAICIYDRDQHTATLLGVPDEGEFSGQTRFLTMPDIFADPASIYKRLRVELKKDFTALMLMTDGVSDPMFGTDVNLKKPEKWEELWTKLINGFPEDGITGVDLDGREESAKDQLLEWLNFWAIGEHDDRTIALLY